MLSQAQFLGYEDGIGTQMLRRAFHIQGSEVRGQGSDIGGQGSGVRGQNKGYMLVKSNNTIKMTPNLDI